MSLRRIDWDRNPELSLKLSAAPEVVDEELLEIDGDCLYLEDSVKIRISIKNAPNLGGDCDAAEPGESIKFPPEARITTRHSGEGITSFKLKRMMISRKTPRSNGKITA